MTRDELYQAAREGDVVALNRIRDLFGQEEARRVQKLRYWKHWNRRRQAEKDLDQEHSAATRRALEEKQRLSPEEFKARQLARRRKKQLEHYYRKKARDLQTLPV